MIFIAIALVAIGAFFSHCAVLSEEAKEPYMRWFVVAWLFWGGAALVFL